MHLSLRGQLKRAWPLGRARSSSALHPPPAHSHTHSIRIPSRSRSWSRSQDSVRPVRSSFRFRSSALPQRKLRSWVGKGAGPQRPRRRTATAAMAVPGSLNRYLLLMAQEHLEFRLPVSRPGVPDAEAHTHSRARLGISGQPHAPGLGRGWEVAGGMILLGDLSPGPALSFIPLHVNLAPQLSRRTWSGPSGLLVRPRTETSHKGAQGSVRSIRIWSSGVVEGLRVVLDEVGK